MVHESQQRLARSGHTPPYVFPRRSVPPDRRGAHPRLARRQRARRLHLCEWRRPHTRRAEPHGRPEHDDRLLPAQARPVVSALPRNALRRPGRRPRRSGQPADVRQSADNVQPHRISRHGIAVLLHRARLVVHLADHPNVSGVSVPPAMAAAHGSRVVLRRDAGDHDRVARGRDPVFATPLHVDDRHVRWNAPRGILRLVW